MCLNLTKEDAVKKTASSDIICYKIVRKLSPTTSEISIDIKGFVPCVTVINSYIGKMEIEGYLYSDITGDYILHDNNTFNGNTPLPTDEIIEFMKENRYSWAIDYNVLSIKVKEEEILITDSEKYRKIDRKDWYITLYRDAFVKLEEKYTSELCVYYYPLSSNYPYSVEEGLHSLKNLEETKEYVQKYCPNIIIIECVIPEGAEYYEGSFNNLRSYASDTLIYKKEISCV